MPRRVKSQSKKIYEQSREVLRRSTTSLRRESVSTLGLDNREEATSSEESLALSRAESMRV